LELSAGTMRHFYQIILIHVLAGLSFFMVACTEGSCFDETESQVKSTFYDKQTLSPHAPDSVTLYGINMDSLMIYDNAINQKIIEFPLYGEDSRRKFTLIINGIYDTVEFAYNSSIHLISKECGYTFYYNLDTVWYSTNAIDSVSITKKTVTTFNEENMRIFY
jgi:ABC-type oligopeptide transport system substrate-binding subunit